MATLARSGERGRALAAARNAPPVPVTEQVVQEIKSLNPTDPDPVVPAQTVSGLFLSEVAHLVPTTLRKMPRLSESGSACALSTGTTLEIKLETATCLCKLQHTSQRLQSRTRCCSTSDLVKSRRSPNSLVDARHSS